MYRHLDLDLDLDALFRPQSVAVIGASSRRESVGRAIFENVLLHGYQGIVYPVHPRAKSIMGVRAYPSILEVPDAVEQAVIVVPHKVVPQVLEECGRKGVRAAVVITAGFKEIGPEGAALEEELIQIAQEYRIALLGPNCFGLINTDPSVSLNATFGRHMPRSGQIAFISQSGAVGVSALEYAHAEGIGLSKFLSVGNKACLHEGHLLAWLKDDPQTDVILLYVEDLEEPRAFLEQARAMTGSKVRPQPILAIKSGRTAAGAQAARSHTGALAGSDEAYDALFMQCGILRVESMEQLFDYAKAFARQPLPRGDSVAIVTNAGGPGIMATDAGERQGLYIRPLSEETQRRLRERLPPTASVRNPVDLIGDADETRYAHALETVLADEAVDGALVICTPQLLTDLEAIARVIAETVGRTRKPVLTCLMALGVGDISEAARVLDAAGVPNYRFPEAAARAWAALAEYARWVRRPRTEIKTFPVRADQARKILQKARQEGRTSLMEPEAQAVLRAYGFPVVSTRRAHSLEEARRAAEEIGYPVVLKVLSPDILHKVDVGGVRLDIEDETALEGAYEELLAKVRAARPKARLLGAVVQEYVTGGKEVILGLQRDPHFGPLLMFGLGGTYVEVFKDVTFRLAPIRALSARHMIEQIRGSALLRGVRGEPPADLDALAECLQRLSQLAVELEEVRELDINPLVVFEEGRGARVLDARILLRAEAD